MQAQITPFPFLKKRNKYPNRRIFKQKMLNFYRLIIVLLDKKPFFRYSTGITAMSDVTLPHTVFAELQAIMDDMRRRSFLALNAGMQKKLQGLSVRQGSAISQLKLLTETNPQGVALKTLAKRLQMTIPATSLLVETMVGKGLFERTPNPEDRRAVCIRLSEKGTQMFHDVYAHYYQELDARAKDFSVAELQTLQGIVDKLKATQQA